MSTKCSGCGKPIQSLDFLECSACQETYDLLCLGFDGESFRVMSQETKDRWICPVCTSSRPKGDNTHTPIGSPSCSLNSTYNTLDRGNTTLDRVNNLRGNRRQVTAPSLFCESEISQLVSEIRQLREEIQEIKDQNKEIALLRQDVFALKEQVLSVPLAFAASKDEYEKKIIAQDAEIADLKRSVSNLQSLFNMQEQNILRNELEIAGVPEADSENLQHVAMVMASRLGVELTAGDLDCVRRVGLKRPQTVLNKEWMPRPIVVKLLRRSKRDVIIQSAKARRNLTSETVAQGTARKVYINERLTKANRALFKESRTRAQQYNFRYCWIRYGAIFMRQTEKKPAILIRSQSDLDQQVGQAQEAVMVLN